MAYAKARHYVVVVDPVEKGGDVGVLTGTTAGEAPPYDALDAADVPRPLLRSTRRLVDLVFVACQLPDPSYYQNDEKDQENTGNV